MKFWRKGSRRQSCSLSWGLAAFRPFPWVATFPFRSRHLRGGHGRGPVAWGPGQLHPHPSSVHVLAVHVVNRVVRIPAAVELDEGVSVLDNDLVQASVTLEEFFDIPLPGVRGDVPDVDSLS